jgi:hypothetical protein
VDGESVLHLIVFFILEDGDRTVLRLARAMDDQFDGAIGPFDDLPVAA